MQNSMQRARTFRRASYGNLPAFLRTGRPCTPAILRFVHEAAPDMMFSDISSRRTGTCVNVILIKRL